MLIMLFTVRIPPIIILKKKWDGGSYCTNELQHPSFWNTHAVAPVSPRAIQGLKACDVQAPPGVAEWNDMTGWRWFQGCNS